jgi:hypothetical protein
VLADRNTAKTLVTIKIRRITNTAAKRTTEETVIRNIFLLIYQKYKSTFMNNNTIVLQLSLAEIQKYQNN